MPVATPRFTSTETSAVVAEMLNHAFEDSLESREVLSGFQRRKLPKVHVACEDGVVSVRRDVFHLLCQYLEFSEEFTEELAQYTGDEFNPDYWWARENLADVNEQLTFNWDSDVLSNVLDLRVGSHEGTGQRLVMVAIHLEGDVRQGYCPTAVFTIDEDMELDFFADMKSVTATCTSCPDVFMTFYETSMEWDSANGGGETDEPAGCPDCGSTETLEFIN